jgi:hypothetical protein
MSAGTGTALLMMAAAAADQVCFLQLVEPWLGQTGRE